MLLKPSDSRDHDIAALETLAVRPEVTPAIRKKIDAERRKVLSGIKGEKDAAYHLDFHFGSRKNSILIHDLRLEHDGRVAQIDHLLINRFLDIWVFESKRFSDGIGINEHGECSAFYRGRPYGIPSPFEQNQRHIDVLKSVFDDDVVRLPKRLGLTIRPKYLPRVLISVDARISRPAKKRPEVDTIVKADQVGSRVDRDIEMNSSILQAHTIAKVISAQTLQDLGASLIAAHRPATFDWAARFGLTTVEPPASAPIIEATGSTPAEEPSAAGQTCAACAVSVSTKVADYCAAYPKRFQGNVFCYGCQRNKAKRQAAMAIAAE